MTNLTATQTTTSTTSKEISTMKKTIIATAIALTSTTAMATVDTSTYNSASAIRDGLTSVYSDLGGVFSTSASGAEYAELLYRVDNIGDVNPIMIAIDPTTGWVTKSGGDATGLFTVDEVITQVDTFVADLNGDLFGTGQPGSGNVVLTPTGGAGLATSKLDDIIADVNVANAIITDNTKTIEEKEAAVANFQTLFDTKSTAFNNAVDALDSITAGINNYSTEADFGSFILGGSGTTTAAMEGASIREGNNLYDSYTDYVAGVFTAYRESQTFTFGTTAVTADFPVAGEVTGGGNEYFVDVNGDGVNDYRIHDDETFLNGYGLVDPLNGAPAYNDNRTELSTIFDWVAEQEL